MIGQLRKGTVCFIKQNNQILLVLIEYSSTDRKWTGIGGYVEEDESLEEAVVREAKEETYITLNKDKLKKVAELNMSFQLNVFLTNTWYGTLKIKEPSLKKIRWFGLNDLPYKKMHPGTENWLPKVLNNKLIRIDGNVLKEVINFD